MEKACTKPKNLAWKYILFVFISLWVIHGILRTHNQDLFLMLGVVINEAVNLPIRPKLFV